MDINALLMNLNTQFISIPGNCLLSTNLYEICQKRIIEQEFIEKKKVYYRLNRDCLWIYVFCEPDFNNLMCE